jgi:hypothetical protein
MKIITTVFDYARTSFDYQQLYDVFVASCRKHMPDVEVVTLELDVPMQKDDRKPGLWINTCKLRAQVEYLEHTDDDVVFCDCDMLCLRSNEDVWNMPFDIGYTEKPAWKKTRCRLNGGVVFVRNTERAHAWMRKLLEINDRMYYDYRFHKPWRVKYFGMNQSAMGYMIEMHPEIADVVSLPTQVWNAVDCDWQYVNEETRFVHIKGKLRHCVFLREGYPWMYDILKEWSSYTDRKEITVSEKMPWDIKKEEVKVEQVKKKKRVRGFDYRRTRL